MNVITANLPAVGAPEIPPRSSPGPLRFPTLYLFHRNMIETGREKQARPNPLIRFGAINHICLVM